jgi:hypothetical protein
MKMASARAQTCLVIKLGELPSTSKHATAAGITCGKEICMATFSRPSTRLNNVLELRRKTELLVHVALGSEML